MSELGDCGARNYDSWYIPLGRPLVIYSYSSYVMTTISKILRFAIWHYVSLYGNVCIANAKLTRLSLTLHVMPHKVTMPFCNGRQAQDTL